MGKLNNHQKQMATPWKTMPQKRSCNSKKQRTGTCTNVGTIILFIKSPSMSSTGWKQPGWKLLGGAAERVTWSASGTNASHRANEGNTCCRARSLVCRRLLPLGTFTPSTSRHCDNASLVQSRSLRFCVAIINFACILATPCLLSGFRGVANSSALLFSPSSQTSSTTFTTTSVQGCGPAKKHAWHTKHVLHQMRTTCLHVAHCIPLRKVMKS